MSAITTHVLDLTRGVPARGMGVTLEIYMIERGWVKLGEKATDLEGRVRDFFKPGSALDPAHYRLIFEVGEYFRALGETSFYPGVTVTFEVRDPTQHHHVPLLVSPYGYSTYRGS
ncbi:MAG TPA: hydroxyisourate hydrolase [Candidatus Eisenbacteria bacterium]